MVGRKTITLLLDEEESDEDWVEKRRQFSKHTVNRLVIFQAKNEMTLQIKEKHVTKTHL
jgi:hypothetical protein